MFPSIYISISISIPISKVYYIHPPTNLSIHPIKQALRFLPYPVQQCDYFSPYLNRRLEFICWRN